MMVIFRQPLHIVGMLALSLLLFSSATFAAENVLQNSSFEFSGSLDELPPGWMVFAGEMGKQMWVEKGHAADGEHALIIDTGGIRNTGLRSNPIPAVPGDVYDAAVMVYATPGNRPALYLDYWNANKQRIAVKSATATQIERWETLKTSLEAPPGTEWVSIILYANAVSNPGRVILDKASLSQDMSYRVKLSTDRPDAIYALDEAVTFIIRVDQGGQPVTDMDVEWRLTNDGVAALGTGRARLIDGEARVVGRLNQPGFLRLQVTVRDSDGPKVADVAAGIAPYLIEPSMPQPDDFDAFWNEKKAALAAVPATAYLTPVNSGHPNIESFDVQVDSLGAPVSGYMARPADAAAGSLPAIITLHGAGYGGAGLGTATGWAREGVLALDINAHGIPNGQPAAYYTQLSQGKLNTYWLQGRESRETFYFLGMFLRVIRAIDFLTSKPEWDRKTLILYGTSQGGAQSLAGAGLDDRVSFFVAGVTGMADLTGTTIGRPMGWPNMADLGRLPLEQTQNILETLRYFDGVNFASRSKADGFFTVGFLDATCRPTTVYAAYNALRGEKEIYNDLFAVHENTPEAVRRMREAVHNHIAKMKLNTAALS